MKIEITIEEVQYLQDYGILPELNPVPVLRRNLEEANKEIADLQDRLDRAHCRVNELETKLAVNRISDSGVTSIESQLSRCQEQLTLACQRADDAELRIIEMAIRIKETSDKLSETTAERDTLRGLLDTCTREIGSLRSRLEQGKLIANDDSIYSDRRFSRDSGDPA